MWFLWFGVMWFVLCEVVLHLCSLLFKSTELMDVTSARPLVFFFPCLYAHLPVRPVNQLGCLKYDH